MNEWEKQRKNNISEQKLSVSNAEWDYVQKKNVITFS